MSSALDITRCLLASVGNRSWRGALLSVNGVGVAGARMTANATPGVVADNTPNAFSFPSQSSQMPYFNFPPNYTPASDFSR